MKFRKGSADRGYINKYKYMKITEKELTLAQLIGNRDLYLSLYREIRDFSRVLEIHEKVIEPLDRILKAYDNKVEALREKHKKNPQEADVEYQELRLQKINVKMAMVEQDDIKNLGLNPMEYFAIKEFVNPKDTKK